VVDYIYECAFVIYYISMR